MCGAMSDTHGAGTGDPISAKNLCAASLQRDDGRIDALRCGGALQSDARHETCVADALHLLYLRVGECARDGVLPYVQVRRRDVDTEIVLRGIAEHCMSETEIHALDGSVVHDALDIERSRDGVAAHCGCGVAQKEIRLHLYIDVGRALHVHVNGVARVDPWSVVVSGDKLVMPLEHSGGELSVLVDIHVDGRLEREAHLIELHAHRSRRAPELQALTLIPHASGERCLRLVEVVVSA